MRVLICGGRNYDKFFEFSESVDKIFSEEQILDPVIIHGGATGADELANRYAEMNNFRCLRFPAKWSQFKKLAGPIRNQQMIDEGKPHLVIAFPGGAGTKDMINRSRKASVEVRIIDGP